MTQPMRPQARQVHGEALELEEVARQGLAPRLRSGCGPIHAETPIVGLRNASGRHYRGTVDDGVFQGKGLRSLMAAGPFSQQRGGAV
jgi:hypothetical protein